MGRTWVEYAIILEEFALLKIARTLPDRVREIFSKVPPPPLTHVLDHVASGKQGSHKGINQCFKSIPKVQKVLRRIPKVLDNFICSIKIGTQKPRGCGRRPLKI